MSGRFLNKIQLRRSAEPQLKKLGWNWMIAHDTGPYITDYAAVISPEEAENFRQATEELYEMSIAAAQYVLDNDLLEQVGVPKSLREIVRFSWEDERLLPLYGRFDLAGGTNGLPLKMLEFNADTAVCIAETAVLQWAQLMDNQLNDSLQFNFLFEALTENWRRLSELNPDKEPTLLFSYPDGYPEDFTTVSVLGEAAVQAGFEVNYCPIEETEFSPEGVFSRSKNGLIKHDFWFKLIPWVWIAEDEPELAGILSENILNRRTIILNPPYACLLESKALMKYMYDLFPDSPYLLKTDFSPPAGKHVIKPVMGREGANVLIKDPFGKILHSTEGDYETMPVIYQSFAELARDREGFCQAGVFMAGEACGLGFRCGKEIMDDYSRFLGHLIR